jgi:AraC-like DNA-binding protein
MKYEYDLLKPSFEISQFNILTVSRNENYRHSYMDGRPYHAFIYTDCGKILDSFAHPIKKDIIAETGTLIFVPKGTRYQSTYLESGTTLKIIQFDINSGELPEYLSYPQEILLANGKSIVNSFFESVESTKFNHIFHYLSLLYDFLWQIDMQHRRLPKKYSRLSAALDDISLYPQKNDKIADYAKMCYMSEVNFRRLFREHMGKSPIEYRNELRLQKAKTMLQSGEYNVSECAEASGFSNISFFIRLYKKKFGYTPKQE